MACSLLEKGFYDSGTGKHQSNTVFSAKGLCPTITTIRGGGTIQIKILRKLDKADDMAIIPESKAKQSKAKHCRLVGSMNNSDNTFESSNRVYDRKYCCPTIPTCQGGNLQPKVLRKWKRE